MSILVFFLGLVYWAIYVLTLPARLLYYLQRIPTRAWKRRAGTRNYTLGRRSSEFGTYSQGNRYFNCESNGDLLLPRAKEGVGSQSPACITDFMLTAAQRHPNAPALQWQTDPHSPFVKLTWSQYYESVKQTARALIALGMRPFESVNILGFNSPEWFMACLGAIFAGGKAAGIYHTNDSQNCEYITQHSEARVVVVEDVIQLNKYADIHSRLPNVVAIVIYRPPADFVPQNFGHIRILTWPQFMELGTLEYERELLDRLSQQSPGHCATLIYTSGTTGPPKAVMISNDNLTWTAQMILSVIPGIGDQPENWVTYLPLSHIAAQMLDIHVPIFASATTANASTVWFARPDALRGTLVETLRAARPTIFFGVPRVFEKIREGLLAAPKTPLMTLIGNWAKSVGFAKFQSDQLNSVADPPLSYPIARLIFKLIKGKLGLDRCRYFISGAAPIHQDVLDYFGSIDINVHQVYGMSECTGPATLDLPEITKSGSCGPALPGIEIKLDHVDGRDKPGEGEVCYRGRNIMMGYMKDEAKTRESIDDEGWLHSGDVGSIDDNGFLYITGRIKELIITSGGENIAPVPVEDSIKRLLPALSNVMMIGDRKKFCTCLVTLKTLPDHETGRATDVLSNEACLVDPACRTVADAQASAIWNQYIERGIKQYNATAPSNPQKIQKFRILDEDFSIGNGDLTPTLKLKRSVVTEKYRDIIQSMYPEDD